MDTMTEIRTTLRDYGTLRFVCSEDRYSVYEDADGIEVYLAHGTARALVDLDDIDLMAEWNKFVRTHSEARYPSGAYNTEAFREMLRGMVLEDPDEVDERVSFCDDCTEPDWDDEMRGTGYDTRVCESCLENRYWFCDDCEEYYRETTTTLSDTEVCDSCRSRNWSFCENCDGYYQDDYASDHQHAQGMCCESPAPVFRVRNDGEAPLDNDTRASVSLPAGVISDEGINEIASYLRSYAWECAGDDADRLRAVACRLDDLGPQWQTKQGNFTKRLSRFAYNEFKLKLAPEVVSRVGCIARDHSTAVDFAIEVTRDLNLPAEEFYHEDSCWWQSYYESRCALKTNGGFGLRTFAENSWGSTVAGRAWVMPLRQTEDGTLTPTFETLTPDAFVVFNGYGDLEGYIPARIVSHMAGMTYRKIGFTCSPMYVNNSSGYLVAPEEIASKYTDGSLTLHVESHSSLFHTEQQNNEKKVLTHV